MATIDCERSFQIDVGEKLIETANKQKFVDAVEFRVIARQKARL